MFANTKALILLAIVYTTGTIAMDASEIAAIFKKYDVEEDEEPDCQEQSIDVHLCPKDEKLPCASIEEIEAYCKEKVGDEFSNSSEKEKGTNAVAGCMKYVGYHIVTDSHIACCESSHCESWLEDVFENLENYYDDDDDDYYDGEGEEF